MAKLYLGWPGGENITAVIPNQLNPGEGLNTFDVSRRIRYQGGTVRDVGTACVQVTVGPGGIEKIVSGLNSEPDDDRSIRETAIFEPPYALDANPGTAAVYIRKAASDFGGRVLDVAAATVGATCAIESSLIVSDYRPQF